MLWLVLSIEMVEESSTALGPPYRCKVLKCSTCFKCNRGGCAQDGIRVGSKLARKRGGVQGNPITTKILRRKASKQLYKEGALTESTTEIQIADRCIAIKRLVNSNGYDSYSSEEKGKGKIIYHH